MKYKFLTLAIAGMMISGANVNAAQWETKARNIAASDVIRYENACSHEVLDHLACYLDEEDNNIECLSNIVYAILDSVNAANPEQAFKQRWDADHAHHGGCAIKIGGLIPSTYVQNTYNETVTQDTVNEFYRAVVATRNNLEATNPNSPNIARLNALVRVLVATDIPDFVKSYTPLLILLRDKVLTILNH